MSIARHFTKRVKSSDMPDFIANRRADVARDRKSTTPSIIRSKISGPVALLSTTNMLSYNAPDVGAVRHVSSSSSETSSSAEDSDHTSSSSSSQESLTDTSSVELSPVSPKPNHLSEYFNQATNKKSSFVSCKTSSVLEHKSKISISSTLTSTSTSSDKPAQPPALPQRALSHSKRAHEQLARKRSMHSVSNSISSSSAITRTSLDNHHRSYQPPPPTRASREHRSSVDIFSGAAAVDADHPFGSELQQLTEVAEELGDVIKDAAREEDQVAFANRGLCAFSAAEYLAEIRPLFTGVFEVAPVIMPVAAEVGWI